MPIDDLSFPKFRFIPYGRALRVLMRRCRATRRSRMSSDEHDPRVPSTSWFSRRGFSTTRAKPVASARLHSIRS